MCSVLLKCTYGAFFFSSQTSLASVSDSSIYICGIYGTNFYQPPSRQKTG